MPLFAEGLVDHQCCEQRGSQHGHERNRERGGVGLGLLLFDAPALVGLSWPAVMLWMPDLALILSATGGLFFTIGAVRFARIMSAIVAARKQPTTGKVASDSDTHSATRSGGRRELRRMGAGEPNDGGGASAETMSESIDHDQKGGRR